MRFFRQVIPVIKDPLCVLITEAVEKGLGGGIIGKASSDPPAELNEKTFEGPLFGMIRAEQTLSVFVMPESQAAERAFLTAVYASSHKNPLFRLCGTAVSSKCGLRPDTLHSRNL
jgi:hypothetical protein